MPNRLSQWLNRRAGRCEHVIKSRTFWGLFTTYFCGHPGMEERCCFGFHLKVVDQTLRSNGLTDDGMCPLGRIHPLTLTDEEWWGREEYVRESVRLSISIEECFARCDEIDAMLEVA